MLWSLLLRFPSRKIEKNVAKRLIGRLSEQRGPLRCSHDCIEHFRSGEVKLKEYVYDQMGWIDSMRERIQERLNEWMKLKASGSLGEKTELRLAKQSFPAPMI